MKHKIIITEDDPVTVRYMEHNAKMLGYEIAGITDSAEEAIQLCKTKQPDIVLMDINLSGQLDGIDAAKTIINSLNIPVLFVSNNLDNETLQRAVSSNSYGYLLKPIKKEQLYTMVEMTIQRNELEKQLKAKDQELKQLNKDLEAKVAQRTAKLIESKEDLEMFTFTTSHELISPLHFINFSLESNFHDLSKKELVKIMTDLKGTCSKMRSQLQDVLSFSKIGRHDTKLSSIEMNTLVNELIDSFSKDFDLSRYKIKINKLPAISSDIKLVKEVLQQLIKNALMYSAPVSSPEIEISGSNDGGQIQFSVKDNGTGYDETKSSALFSYFERLHSDDEFPGNGLGLSIALKAINKLNGKIWGESKGGAGAKFYFTLPSANT